MRTTAMYLLPFSLLLIGCNKNKQGANAAIAVDLYPQEELLAWEQEIELDKGSQWKANRETTAGVDKMSAIIQRSSPATVAEYKNLGDTLISEINILISACTMKGPSHDNLHIFLEPLIIKTARLEQSVTEQEGQALTGEIHRHLRAYHKYFN